MKTKLYLFIMIFINMFIILNTSAYSSESTYDEWAYSILNDFYNDGVYKKVSSINLVEESKEELAKLFHASVNNLHRITYYDNEEIWMTNLENTINSGYITIDGDMKHFSKINNENIYDYTVKNTITTEYYQTLKNLQYEKGWENKIVYGKYAGFINYNKDVIDRFCQFVAPLWLNNEEANKYIILTSIQFYQVKDELHFELYCSNADDGKINNSKGIFAEAIVTNDLKVFNENGVKLVKYGSYPQTHVNDQSLITELNKLTTKNTRGYYVYNGKEYAKITAKPYWTGNSYIYSDGSLVKFNVVEWFLVEPIKWRVIFDGETYTLLSDMIIDAKKFNHYSENYFDNQYKIINGEEVYINNYKYSDIREFLNSTFVKNAFNNCEAERLVVNEIDNGIDTVDDRNNKYVCENTYDKVYLWSYREAFYRFNNESLASSSLGRAKVTDYAKANGVWWEISGQNIDTGPWWLRSPDSKYYFCAEKYDFGSIRSCDTIEIEGVRPAIEVITLN